MIRPGDIYPESGNRLPPIDRAALDPAGQAIYDEILGDTRSLAGLRGPAGISMRSPRYYAQHRKANQMLRFDSGLEPRLRELAILVTARECDSAFEWNAHDQHAQREGLEREIIDIVRKRKSVRGLGPKEAAIIKLGADVRQTSRAPFDLRCGARVVRSRDAGQPRGAHGRVLRTAALLTVFAQQLPEGAKSALD